MKEWPIIFSPPMIRGLLAGNKVKTRRLAWSDWKDCEDQPSEIQEDWECRGRDMRYSEGTPRQVTGYRKPSLWRKAKPGDLLWVRETCRAEELEEDGRDGVRFEADGAWKPIQNTEEASQQWLDLFHYRQSDPPTDYLIGKQVPAIHMPRWVCRLELHLTAVRVEPLLDITEEDAIAEGATSRPGGYRDPDWSMDWSRIGTPSPHASHDGILSQSDIALGSARWAFLEYWNSLQRTPGDFTPSDRNPEVVVLTFQREMAECAA